MTVLSDSAGAAVPAPVLRRSSLVLVAAAFVFICALFVGGRYGLMLAIGLGFGIVLEGLRFGFAGPWRAMILRRDPAGMWAQLIAIGLVASVALPLIADNPGELVGAQAPIGFAMIGGAFVFGIAMQVVLGCGSGTLVNSGSGNPVSLLALPFFAIGSFAGSYHLLWWTDLGALPIENLSGWQGVAITLAGLLLVGAVLWAWAAPENRRLPRRLMIAAACLAGLALLNLVVAGQPWGVVYGLGLWVAKIVSSSGVDLAGSAFWAAPTSQTRLNSSVLTDYTSLTNIGIILGAYFVASWRIGGFSQKLPSLPMTAWIATILAGFLLGYSSRLAFGCNVGAFFSGISTGSLHGWVWFAAAFIGSFYGIKVRRLAGLEPRT
ncbi:MAG: YeeE/YedE family protein [Roseibium sp.]